MAKKIPMTKPSIARELNRQMKAYAPGLGPIDYDELQRKFPTVTKAEIDRDVSRWLNRRSDRMYLQYGEHQFNMAGNFTSVLDGGEYGPEYAPTFTELEEAAKAAIDCRVPLGWSDTQSVLKRTGEDMKGKTIGQAARAILRWVYRQDLAATLEGLQATTPWSLDAKLLDQVLREIGAEPYDETDKPG